VHLIVKVDKGALLSITPDIRRGALLALTRATERGVEIMREEAPGTPDGPLHKGIRPHVDAENLTGEIEVSAIRPAQPEKEIVVTGRAGNQRTVKFAAQPEHDYALDVIEGTGLYGRRGQRITPKNAKRLRLTFGGRTIFAASTAGQRPNPFPERTARRLEAEIPAIFEGELEVLNKA
jgi:hypothetical protein